MKHLYSIIFFFLFSLGINGQCLQDTLFQCHLKNNDELVVGEKYILQKEKLDHKGISPFVRANETPEFDHTGRPLNAVKYSEIQNNALLFLGLAEDEVYIIREDTISFKVLRFECNGEQYKSFKNINRTKDRKISRYSNALYNDLVVLSFVEKIKEALEGKTVYVLTSKWFKEREEDHEIVLAEGNTYKYYPVQITSVYNENSNNFIVNFKPQGSDEIFCFVNVMFGEKDMKSSYNFFRKMTFENPKTKYPKISDKKWKIIQEQKIEKGLTTDEIRIAFGKPNEVHNKNGNDVWVYFNNNEKDYVLTFKKDKVHDYYIGPASRYIHLIF